MRAVALAGLLVVAVVARGQEATAPPPFRLSPSPDLAEPGKKPASDAAQELARRALAAMGQGNLAAAKRDFLKVLDRLPDNVPTLINLGLLEYRRKNYAEAENRLRKVVRLAPESGLGWLVLGVVQYDQARYDHALASLAQAAVLEPKNAVVHQYLGVTLGQKGWYSGAEDEMRKALQFDPNYAEAHFNLAVFYLQRSPPAVELARRHYVRARDLGTAPDADVERRLGP